MQRRCFNNEALHECASGYVNQLSRHLPGVLVHELVTGRRVDDPLDILTVREREVLSLMAEGRSNAGIARQLWVTEGTVEKHVHSILQKLRLPETGDDHRRVLAVITYLDVR